MRFERWMAVVVMVTSAGCATKIPLRMMRPGEKDLSQFRRVSVTQFQGKCGPEFTSQVESTMNAVRVNGEPYFTLIDRARLDTVLREQKLNTSGLADEKKGPKIGKLLGADAFIFGTMNECDAKDSHSTQSYKTKKGTVYQSCIERIARVRVSTKFVNASTGSIQDSMELQGEAKDSGCADSGQAINVADASVLLQSATQQILAAFAKNVAPYEVIEQRELREKHDDIGVFGGGTEAAQACSQHLKTGAVYAKNGNWTLAVDSFQKAIDADPTCAAAYYNLGVGLEAQGKLAQAREMYQKAAQLKADPLYISATASIERAISDRQRLEQQSRSRPQ